jgi:hypothetical protein
MVSTENRSHHWFILIHYGLQQSLKNHDSTEYASYEDFYAVGLDALVKRWDKCANVGGGYVER